MLKISNQCYIKDIMMLQIKIIMQVLKISTYIITSITARPSGFTAILAVSVSTFKTAVIL